MVNIAKIDLNLLSVFEAVWLERNVSKAAKRLGLSQPATSSALARLRVLLDDQLLIPTRAGMSPTAKAESVAQAILNSLEQARAAFAPAEDFKPQKCKTHFRAVSTDYGQLMLLPAIHREVSRQAPLVRISIQSIGDTVPTQELENGTLDGAFSPHVVEGRASIYRQKLFTESFVCAVRKSHPRIHKSLSKKEFQDADHVLVSFGAQQSLAFGSELVMRNVARRVSVTVPQFFTALKIASESDLIALVPRRLALHFAPLLGLEIFKPPVLVPDFTIYQYWHDRTNRSPEHIWFRKIIEELCKARA